MSITKNTAYREVAKDLKAALGISYPSDLSYTGMWDGLHHMTYQTPVWYKDEKGNETRSMARYQYADVAFDDEDAANGNLRYFVEHGFTRFERVGEE